MLRLISLSHSCSSLHDAQSLKRAIILSLLFGVWSFDHCSTSPLQDVYHRFARDMDLIAHAGALYSRRDQAYSHHLFHLPQCSEAVRCHYASCPATLFHFIHSNPAHNPPTQVQD